MSKLLEAIERAMRESGESRYSIAKGSGVSEAQLSRFVNGERGLSVEAIEQLADYFGLEIIVRPKRRNAKGR